jgi:TRAP-type C4-dicarboxylate transport system permease small subunit
MTENTSKKNSKTLLQKIDADGERWLLLIFYSMIVLVIGVEVFRRFALSYSSTWGEEIARYSFIYLAWIGASAAIKERAHIRIDVIQNFLPRKGQLFIYIFGDLITLIVACFALYYSFEMLSVTIKFGSVTHGLGIQQAWFLAAVPIGFSMVTFRTLQSLYRDIGMWNKSTPLYHGQKLFD